MSRVAHRTFFRLAAMDERVGEALVLNRSKLLIGSDQRCDVVLAVRGISPQHCYVMVVGENVRVMDLASTNGIFVNGKRVRDAVLFPGDTLTIADLAFNVESFEEAAPFIDVEAEVPALMEAQLMDAPVMVPDRAGLTLIDQEYCDLKIEESTADLVSKPSFIVVIEEKVEELDSSTDPLDLVHSEAGERVEVVLYSSGHVVDIQFLDLKNDNLVLSPNPKKNQVWFPSITSDLTVLEHRGNKLHINTPEGFTLSGSNDLSGEASFLTFGVHQLSLRYVDQQFKIKPLPMFWRDRQFYRDAGKIAAGVFLPFLLLLLITVPEMKVEEVKQITIVYKAQKVTDGDANTQISATEVTSKTENTGTKATEQPKKEAVMAASSAPAPAQQQAEAAAAAAPAKPKAFKFKSSVSLDSVVADAAPANTAGSGRAPAATSKGIGASQSALGGSATGAGTSVGVGKLGSDASGTGTTSSGAKGLVSKKGFDHSYLEPKTVVLGSMDPELLRKILQEYLPQFRHCYQQELMGASKDIKGVIDLDFQISPDGRVSRADIKAKDARFSRKGTDCMAKVLRIIEFPKPKGGGVVDVRQPLNFFAETEKI